MKSRARTLPRTQRMSKRRGREVKKIQVNVHWSKIRDLRAVLFLTMVIILLLAFNTRFFFEIASTRFGVEHGVISNMCIVAAEKSKG